MPMKSVPRALLLASFAWLAGCSLFPDPKRDQAQLNDRIQNDTDERKARLKAKGTLSPQEYELMARKMGWTTCLLYTSPSPRDRQKSRMPSSA